jgi:hypothetical protein
MRAISGRIRRLEDQLGLSKAAEETARRLWGRLEAGRRRVAEWRGEPFVPQPYGTFIRDELEGLSHIEILHRGRLRCAQSRKEYTTESISTRLTARATAKPAEVNHHRHQ